MVAGSSLWMRRQAGLPRTWRPVRPEAARGACGQAQGATPQAAASWAWKRLRSGQGPPEGLTGHTVPAVVAGRTERGLCLHRRRQPGAPGGVQPRPSDSGLTGCGCPVTRSLVGCYGRRTPTHDGEAACARTRARWEGRRVGGMEPCPWGLCRLCCCHAGSKRAGGWGHGPGVQVRSPPGEARWPGASPSGWTAFPARHVRHCPRWTETRPRPSRGRRLAASGGRWVRRKNAATPAGSRGPFI